MARGILDENLDRRLAGGFVGHNVTTVAAMGWAGLPDVELLQRCARVFDFFVTADQNLRHQQNVAALPFGIVVLAGRSNRLTDLLPLVPRALAVMESLQPGGVAEVRAPGYAD